MPVAAGMRDELLLRAIAALVQVAAELRGLAGHDRTQHPPVLRWQTVLLAIVGQFDAELRGPPTKRKSPRRGHSTGLPTKATHKNHVWTWDFIADATVRGGALRTLSVLDEFTRECHVLKADRALKSGDVITLVQGAIAQHGAPDHIRSDNGPEFIAKELQRWLAANKIKTLYIEPGSPWQNGFVESFHSRFRDECLNREQLWTLTEARVVIEDYREKYNRVRPHSKLGYQSPARYAASLHPSLAPVRPAEPGLPSARDGQPASVVSASTNHPDRL
jgi:transposase InsO family protein